MDAKSLKGKNNFLFLHGDANCVLDQIQGRRPLTEPMLLEWREELARRKAHALANNYRYQLLIVPNKHCVYPEMLPDGVTLSENRSACQLQKMFPDVIVYPLQFLQDIKNLEPYYKHDTRWTDVGVVETLNNWLGQPTGKTIDYRIKRNLRYGNLPVKFQPRMLLDCPSIEYTNNHEVIFDNRIRNEGHVIITKNNNRALPAAVIFGDSYFTDFIDIVAEYFSKLYYFHTPVFDKGIIEKIKPDFVFNETVERYINWPSRQTFTNETLRKCCAKDFSQKSKFTEITQEKEKFSGLNYNQLRELASIGKRCASAQEYDASRLNFLKKHNLERFKPRGERYFTGLLWKGKSDMFEGWAAGYAHEKHQNLAGFAFILENLLENTQLTLHVYECQGNENNIDPNSLKLLYRKEYAISELGIFADYQEVFFPTPDLLLANGRNYLITIEGSGCLGAGQSFSDLAEENYFFRGYYKQKSKNFLAIPGKNSLAWRPVHAAYIEPDSVSAQPMLPFACKTDEVPQHSQEQDAGLLNLPRKEMIFTGEIWHCDKASLINGWGTGYLHENDANPEFVAFTLQNISANEELRLSIYAYGENIQSINCNELKPIYERSYSLAEIRPYANTQEVFFPTPELKLKEGKAYFITIEGDCCLGAGKSWDDLPDNDYFFRGYYRKLNTAEYNSIADSSSLAWRMVFDNTEIAFALEALCKEIISSDKVSMAEKDFVNSILKDLKEGVFPAKKMISKWLQLAARNPAAAKDHVDRTRADLAFKDNSGAGKDFLDSYGCFPHLVPRLRYDANFLNRIMALIRTDIYYYDFERALKPLEAAIQIFPDFIDPVLIKSRLVYILKKYPMIDDCLARLAAFRIDQPEILELMGKLNYLGKNYANALSCFKELIHNFPESRFARFEAVNNLGLMGEYNLAYELLEEFCQKDFSLDFTRLILALDNESGKDRETSLIQASARLQNNPAIHNPSSLESIVLLNLVRELASINPAYIPWHSSLLQNSFAHVNSKSAQTVTFTRCDDHPFFYIFDSYLPYFPTSCKEVLPMREGLPAHRNEHLPRLAVLCRTFHLRLLSGLLQALPKDQFTLIVDKKSAENTAILEELGFNGEDVEYGFEKAAQYKYVFFDLWHKIPCFSPDQHSIAFVHSCDAILREYSKDVHALIFQYQSAAQTNSIHLIQGEQELLKNVRPEDRIEIAYTGPYNSSLPKALQKADKMAIREELKNRFELDIPADKPLLFFLEDEICTLSSMVSCMNKLAEYCTVFFKPWAFYDKLDGLAPAVRIIPQASITFNYLKWACDFNLVSPFSGSAISLLQRGMPMICYYSPEVKYHQSFLKRHYPLKFQTYLESHYSPFNDKLDFLSDPKNRLQTLLYENDLLFNLDDVERIKKAIFEPEYLSRYHSLRPELCKQIFGDFDISDPAQRTADLLMSYVKNGTFGDECSAILLRDSSGQINA